MKSIALLATALFLASAPSPDAKTITELSAGFLKPTNVQPLLASSTDLAPKKVAIKTAEEPVQDPQIN